MVDLPKPLALPGIEIPRVFARPGVSAKKIGVFSIPKATVFGPSIMVLNRAGTLLEEFSLEWGRPLTETWLFRRWHLPAMQTLPGRTLLLACTGGETFYHFLAEAAAKLALLAKAGQTLRSFDHVLVNDLRRPFVRAVLLASGIDVTLCRETREPCHYFCENLTAPTLPGEMGSPHQDLIDFYRGVFPPSQAGSPRKKIWIRRMERTQRCVLNESALESLWETHGVQPVQLESIPIHEQALLFQEAKLVVAPHGAGLTNLLFARPGGTLVEIFSESYVNQCYRVLAAAAGWDYAPWVIPKTTGLHLKFRARGSLWVNPRRLQEVLQNFSDPA